MNAICKMQADGITPRKTKYQTQKDFLRTAIEESAATSCGLEEFQNQLSEKFNITLKISRGRFSYLHPERNKPITGKNLGTHYEKNIFCNYWKKTKNICHKKMLNMNPCPIATSQIKLAYHPQTRRHYLSHLSLLKQTSALLLICSNA